MDISFADRELNNVQVRECSRPGIPSTLCRCPPGAYHRPDLRRARSEGRRYHLRQAEARFVERLWVTTLGFGSVPGRPVRHPRPALGLDRGGQARRERGTASTPDMETQNSSGLDVLTEPQILTDGIAGAGSVQPEPLNGTPELEEASAEPQVNGGPNCRPSASVSSAVGRRTDPGPETLVEEPPVPAVGKIPEAHPKQWCEGLGFEQGYRFHVPYVNPKFNPKPDVVLRMSLLNVEVKS